MLAQQLGRPVLDKTGLKGSWDFKLEWTPDETQGGMGFGGGAGHEGPPLPAMPQNLRYLPRSRNSLGFGWNLTKDRWKSW